MSDMKDISAEDIQMIAAWCKAHNIQEDLGYEVARDDIKVEMETEPGNVMPTTMFTAEQTLGHNPIVPPLVSPECICGSSNPTVIEKSPGYAYESPPKPPMFTPLPNRALEQPDNLAPFGSEQKQGQSPIPLDHAPKSIAESPIFMPPVMPNMGVKSNSTHPLSAPKSKLEGVLSYADAMPKAVRWLWENRIPMGKLTMIQGEPGVGKSYLALKIAAAVSNGGTLPTEDGDKPVPGGYVVYQSAEDDASDTIATRFSNMKGNHAALLYIDERENALTINDERILEVLKAYRPNLMVLDPLAAYLGYDVDMNRSNQVRPLFAKLARWAEQYNCAIIMITHLSKSKFTKGGVYASLGSIDMAAACRSILGVRNLPYNDKREKILYQVKNNIGIHPRALKFVIDPKHGVNWQGVYSSAKNKDDGNAKAKPATKLEQARKATIDMIRNGINTSKAMKAEYNSKGIKDWAYNRARKKLRADGIIRMSKMKGRYGSKAEAQWEIVEQSNMSNNGIEPQSTSPSSNVE